MAAKKVTGKFDVKLTPSSTYATGVDGVALGRMRLDKTFYGELEARSQGEMLSAMTAVKGSAGYVAIEQVIGKLCGKQGSFVLQHFGVMTNGQNRLILEVVPYSGASATQGTLQHQQHYNLALAPSRRLQL